MSKITLDGKDYVVSPQFEAAIRAELGTMSFNVRDVETERLAISDKSNVRSLTPKELARCDALTHVRNVANAIRVVGAHHDPVKEWGFDGWDTVHGNRHHAPCGCIKLYVFDHHSVFDHFGHNRVSQERTHHEIEPIRLCAAHGG